MPKTDNTRAGRKSEHAFVPEWMPASPAAGNGRSTVFVPAWADPGGHVPAADENPAAGAADEMVRVPAALRESVGPASKHGATAAPLLIRGGRCVIPEQGLFDLDIRLADGKIEAMGHALAADHCEVLDVSGLYVLPGVIDPHTHVGLWDPFATDIATESRSALANGVTTMGVYLGGQTSYLPILDEIVAAIEAKSLTDVFLHLPIFTREQLEEIPIYHRRYGITSFKAYMCGIPGMIPHVEEGFLLDIMTAVAALGPGAILNIHAENARLVQWATARVQQQQPDRPTLADWAATHPDFAEVDAVRQAALLARQAGAKIYFVHIAAGASVAAASKALADS